MEGCNCECCYCPHVRAHIALPVNKEDDVCNPYLMKEVHQNILSDMLGLKYSLSNENNVLEKLNCLYKQGELDDIISSVKQVSNEFIISKLKERTEVVQEKDNTKKDIYLALSLFGKNEKLYRYLSFFFGLPPVNKLKYLLSAIPFKVGINEGMLDQLSEDVSKLRGLNSPCNLLFAEIPLSQGLHYEHAEQQLYGYEELHPLMTERNQADRALVLMAKGLRKDWKQVVAYHFISGRFQDIAVYLQDIITNTISSLVTAGLNVRGVVCEPNCTNINVLSRLCVKSGLGQNSNYFMVNGTNIYIIYDGFHLFMDTGNTSSKCDNDSDKTAKFKHMHRANIIDQNKRVCTCKQLLYNSYFTIDNKSGLLNLNAEAIHTENHMIILFDPVFCKIQSNKMALWESTVRRMKEWEIFRIEAGEKLTSSIVYRYVQAWSELSTENIIDYMKLRYFGLKPLKTLFKDVIQYGSNGNPPTCYQFLNALKTEISGGIDKPCPSLVDMDLVNTNVTEWINPNEFYFDSIDLNTLNQFESHGQVVYLADYLLLKMNKPNCIDCISILFSDSFNMFPEPDHDDFMPEYGKFYASESVIRLVDMILTRLKCFMQEHSIVLNLESRFKNSSLHEFHSICSSKCSHRCEEDLIDLCIQLGIYIFIQ